MARKNKSKDDIVSDIQLTQDAERRRHLIKDVIFPYLLEVNDSIGYTKVFLQSYAGLIEGVYEENRKKTTVGNIHDRVVAKLDTIFTISDPNQKKEYDRYMKLTELLKDISVQDLAYAAELPRYIDGMMLADKGKESISTISIDKILG
jgi:hypothetical protein